MAQHLPGIVPTGVAKARQANRNALQKPAVERDAKLKCGELAWMQRKIIGARQWFEITSSVKTPSNQFCRKMSTGSRFQRFHRPLDWPCLLETQLKPDLI